MAKVAVASTDGISINEHFGRAKAFLIYDVQESGEFKLVEKKTVADDDGEAGHRSIAATAALLAEAEVVLVAQLGPRAEQELRSKGIIALNVTGPIEKALKAYGKRGKYIRNNILRSVPACPPAGCGGGCGCSL